MRTFVIALMSLGLFALGEAQAGEGFHHGGKGRQGKKMARPHVPPGHPGAPGEAAPRPGPRAPGMGGNRGTFRGGMMNRGNRGNRGGRRGLQMLRRLLARHRARMGRGQAPGRPGMQGPGHPGQGSGRMGPGFPRRSGRGQGLGRPGMRGGLRQGARGMNRRMSGRRRMLGARGPEAAPRPARQKQGRGFLEGLRRFAQARRGPGRALKPGAGRGPVAGARGGLLGRLKALRKRFQGKGEGAGMLRNLFQERRGQSGQTMRRLLQKRREAMKKEARKRAAQKKAWPRKPVPSRKPSKRDVPKKGGPGKQFRHGKHLEAPGSAF